MVGRVVLQSALLLCLVQAAQAGGYNAAYGAANGQAPQAEGVRAQNGGVGMLLMPSKGVGRTVEQQSGYAGYLTKGAGYGAAAGRTKGIKGGTPAVFPNGATSIGYGVKAGPSGQQMNGHGAQPGGVGGQRTKGNGQNTAVFPNGGGAKFNGYGVKAGPANRQQIKGYGVVAGLTNGQQMNGYGAQAGGYVGQRTKGIGYGVVSGPTNGQQSKGVGAVAGPSSGNGVQPNGQGRDGSKSVKGLGRPLSGTGMVMGPFRGVGVPQLTRNQEKAYGGNGYNGYRAQPVGAYRGGHGSAGLGLGPRYGSGGLKGPVQGYGAAAGVSNGQGVKTKGYAGVRGTHGNVAVQNGFGNLNAGAAKPAKPGYGGSTGSAVRPQRGYLNGAHSNGYGSKPQSYGAAAGAGVIKGYGAQTNGHGVGTGAALGGYGGKPDGYGLSNGPKPPTKGVGTLSSTEGYGMMNGNVQAVRGADLSNGKSLKGGLLPPQLQMMSQMPDVRSQQFRAQEEVLVAPAPTSSRLGMMTNEKYQKVLSAQEKSYKQMFLVHDPTPEPAPVFPDVRNPNGQPGPALAAQQNSPAPEPAAVLSQGNEGAAKAAKPGCGPNGRWMGMLRSGNGGNGGTYLNGGGAKANKPGGHAFPGLTNGYGAANPVWFGYPYGGKLLPPGYGRGAYLPAGNGNLYGGNLGFVKADKPTSGSVNVYSVGGQPDYTSLGQNVPTADGKSGSNKQLPSSGAPVLPAGIDGMSQFEPQPAALHPDSKSGSKYGAVGGLAFGGKTLGTGAEKSNTKYSIGGLQFGGQPGINGAGQYGYGVNPFGPAGEGGLGAGLGGDPVPGKYGNGGFPNGGQILGLGSNGNIPGKYGYGTYPYEVQQAGLTPEAKSSGPYAHHPGLTGPYQSEHVGLGQSQGKSAGKYGGGEVPYGAQILGFGGNTKPGKYDKQGAYQPQPLESAAEGTAGLIYESRPSESDSAGRPYVKGEVPTSALAAEGEGGSVNRYENLSYINGQAQPNDSLAPDDTSRESAQDLSDPEGSLLESVTAAETQGEVHVPEHPDDLELPRQIQIQQHLKLHFHPQGGKKYDLNGFYGNGDHQG